MSIDTSTFDTATTEFAVPTPQAKVEIPDAIIGQLDEYLNTLKQEALHAITLTARSRIDQTGIASQADLENGWNIALGGARKN